MEDEDIMRKDDEGEDEGLKAIREHEECLDLEEDEILGYECLSCELQSNLEIDFIITEEDVRCKKCGGSVYPMNIEKGVELI